MSSYLALFNIENKSGNLQKLDQFRSNPDMEIALYGNAIDCSSREYKAKDLKPGYFCFSEEWEVASVELVATVPDEYEKPEVYLLKFTNGNSQYREADEKMWARKSSIRNEVAKIQALLVELDVPICYLCPDGGYTVYMVKPYVEFHEINWMSQGHFECRNMNFRLPHTGLVDFAKESHKAKFNMVFD